MYHRGKCIFVIFLAAAVVGSVGCDLPPSRVEFMQTLAKNNRKIARSTRAFRAALQPLKDGKAPSTTEVRKAYDDMEQTLKEVRADTDGQALPVSSGSSAQAFLDAYKAYLDGQQDILQNDLLPIVKKVEEPVVRKAGDPLDEGHPTLAERRAFIDDLLQKVPAKEAETWAPLMQAQDNYTKEHNYQAIGLAGYIANQKAGK